MLSDNVISAQALLDTDAEVNPNPNILWSNINYSLWRESFHSLNSLTDKKHIALKLTESSTALLIIENSHKTVSIPSIL